MFSTDSTFLKIDFHDKRFFQPYTNLFFTNQMEFDFAGNERSRKLNERSKNII